MILQSDYINVNAITMNAITNILVGMLINSEATPIWKDYVLQLSTIFNVDRTGYFYKLMSD